MDISPHSWNPALKILIIAMFHYHSLLEGCLVGKGLMGYMAEQAQQFSLLAIWQCQWLWWANLSSRTCEIERTLLLLWRWRISTLPEAGILERTTVVHSGGYVMWFRMIISAFISFLWMTPSNSLLGSSHVGNGWVWNWILYTLRWLYKGIIQDGYCTIRNVMKLAQRWQL